MKKKKMGRPAAKWVYELSNLSSLTQKYFDYHDLSEMFGVSIRTVHGFCSKAHAEGEYYRHENNVIRKRFTIESLRKAAKEYIKKSVL